MALSLDERHALLLSDRSRDVGQITVVIEHVLPANSDVNLFDVEMAFRDAAWAAYVITGPSKTFHVITGVCRRCWPRSLRPADRLRKTGRRWPALTAADRRSGLLAASAAAAGSRLYRKTPASFSSRE